MSAGAHAFFHDLLALLFRVLDRVHLDDYINRLSWAHAPVMTIGLIAFTFSYGWDDSTRGAWRTLCTSALGALSLSLIVTNGIHFVPAQVQCRISNATASKGALLQTLILRWFVKANRLCGAPQWLPCLIAPTASLARRNRQPLCADCLFVRFTHLIQSLFNPNSFHRPPSRMSRAWAGDVSFPIQIPGELLCITTPT